MRTAARIARLFHLDPMVVLDEDDDFAWAVRVAAYDTVQADLKAAAPNPK